MADNATTEATESAEASTETATEAQASEATPEKGDALDPSVETNTADYWKQRSRQNETKAKQNAEAVRKLEADFAALQAKVEGTEKEHAAAVEAKRVQDEAIAAANTRILNAEIRAVAAGKLADPSDALRYIETSDFEVSQDGAVDSAAIAKAVEDLIASKPYLAAQGGKRFQGSADGGARNDATKVTQLTQADIARMSPEEVSEARKRGQFDDLLGGN